MDDLYLSKTNDQGQTRVISPVFNPSVVNSNQVSQHGLIPGHDNSDMTWVTTLEH